MLARLLSLGASSLLKCMGYGCSALLTAVLLFPVAAYGQQLVIASLVPEETVSLESGSVDYIEYTATVTDEDGTPIYGAELFVDNPFYGEVDYTCCTDEGGVIVYGVELGGNEPDGLYTLTFTASFGSGKSSEGYAASEPVERDIRIGAATLLLDSVTPDGNQFVTPGSSIDYTLRVVDEDSGDAVEGAGIEVEDPFLETVVHVLETDEAGMITYRATVPEDTPEGLYSLSFVAFAEGYESSNPVTRSVDVERLSLQILSALPEDAQILEPGGSVDYRLIIGDAVGNRVEGAGIRVDDPLLQDVVEVVGSDESGVITYRATVPATTPGGEYTLSFVAFASGYTDSPAVERQIGVNRSTLHIASITPTATQNLTPGGSIEYTITVVDGEGNPVEGAGVEVDNPFLGAVVEVSATDENGEVLYTVDVPETISDGTYTLRFRPFAEGYDASSPVERQVTVGRTSLSISSITPEAIQNVTPGSSVEYTITVTDASGLLVQGATVDVSDPLQGSVVETPPTNAQGKTVYTAVVPGGAELRSYTLSFVAKHAAYDESEAVQRQIDVTEAQQCILTVMPLAIDFGAVEPASSAQEIITIQNTGNADLTITAASLSQGTVGFSLESVSLPLVLAPQASATWTVAFTPADVGMQQDLLGIVSDCGEAQVSLQGEGAVSPRIPPEVNPAEVTFAATAVGATSGEQSVTVNNADDESVALNFALEGADADAFVMVSGGAAVSLGPSDPPHAVVLRYEPTCTGEQTATLRVTWDDAPDRTVVLSGTGLAPTLAAPQPESMPTAGEDVRLRMPTPGFAFTQAQLFYRSVGDASFSQVALQQQNGDLVATIPGAGVRGAGLEYYVRIASACAEATFPQGALDSASPAFLAIGVVNVSQAVEPQQYRMLTVPYVLEDAGVDVVFADDFGPYDPAVWRLAAWSPNAAQPDGGSYVEYPALSQVPGVGRAFWLITSEAASFDIDDGTPADPRQPFELTLPAGWHQIGSPHPIAVNWSAVETSAPVQGPHGYNGQEYQLNASQLEPWQGYFVYVPPPGPARVRFPAASQAGKQAAAPAFAEADYVLRLSATVPGYDLLDTQNYVGFAEGRLGDRLNLLEPPPIGDHVRLSIHEEEGRYASYFMAPVEGGGQWDLEVSLSSTPRTAVPVRLSLLEEQPRPDGFEVYVFDRDEGRVLPLEAGTVEVMISAAQPVRHMSLVVGTAAFAQVHSEGVALVPVDFELDGNYPNPFNPETVIRYSVARKEHVVLEVYDALGRRVRHLVAEEQPAANYEVVWDGRDDAGQPVASGVYVYRLRAGSFMKARAMLLLR